MSFQRTWMWRTIGRHHINHPKLRQTSVVFLNLAPQYKSARMSAAGLRMCRKLWFCLVLGANAFVSSQEERSRGISQRTHQCITWEASQRTLTTEAYVASDHTELGKKWQIFDTNERVVFFHSGRSAARATSVGVWIGFAANDSFRLSKEYLAAFQRLPGFPCKTFSLAMDLWGAYPSSGRERLFEATQTRLLCKEGRAWHPDHCLNYF